MVNKDRLVNQDCWVIQEQQDNQDLEVILEVQESMANPVQRDQEEHLETKERKELLANLEHLEAKEPQDHLVELDNLGREVTLDHKVLVETWGLQDHLEMLVQLDLEVTKAL